MSCLQSAPSDRHALVRFLPTGDLDASFGPYGTGKVTQDINGTFDGVHGLVLQADGSILVSAEATAPDDSTEGTAVARFTASGSLDASFGTRRITLTDFSASTRNPYNPGLQNDGGVWKVVVLSNVHNPMSVGLTRYFQ